MTNSDRGPWAREIAVATGSGVRWTLGPMTLSVFRTGDEWQIGHEPAEVEALDRHIAERETLLEVPQQIPSLERFVTTAEDEPLALLPRAADRAIVVRPRMPLHVLPGQTTRVFVSAPVWVEINVGRPQRRLRQLPIKRLSDTWFGPSTLDGELAYALKTQARSRLEEMPRAGHRAITPIVIRNDAPDELLFDRISLPVPYLSIFATPEGHLWTETVTLAREESSEMAALDVQSGAPREAAGAERLNGPRRSAESSVLVRAFNSLLRPFGQED